MVMEPSAPELQGTIIRSAYVVPQLLGTLRIPPNLLESG